jgi:hypothetical protein
VFPTVLLMPILAAPVVETLGYMRCASTGQCTADQRPLVESFDPKRPAVNGRYRATQSGITRRQLSSICLGAIDGKGLRRTLLTTCTWRNPLRNDPTRL